jgi:hypothetical protein
MIVDPPIMRFALRADGGVAIEPEGSRAIDLRPCKGGWVAAVDGEAPWRIERASDDGGGFRLLRKIAEDAEGARTMRLPVAAADDGVARHVLLEDGRLFRLVERASKDPRFELLAWDAPGAYLVARPSGAGWAIEPEAAGGALADLRAIVVLMAMEILDAELPGGIGRTVDDAS